MDRLIDFLLNYYGPVPYALIFGILLLCGIGLPIPEDVTLITAGLVSYYGLTEIVPTIVVAFLGVLVGDSIIFFLGATYGRKLTSHWIFHKLLPDERLDAVKKKLHQRGNRLIFAARFMPGFRAPMFFSAGTLHLPFRVFLSYDGAAALISVPSVIGLVYYFGDELDKVIRIIQRIEHGIVFVVVALVLIILGKWYLTHRKLKQNN